MSAKNVLPTDNGEKFNITLCPGYCFAMCVDLAKYLLEMQKAGRPKRLPVADNLNPNKWAIMQSAYEINAHVNDRRLIEAQNLEIAKEIPETDFNSDFAAVAQTITAIHGTTVFGIMAEDDDGDSSGHELMWHRDDNNSVWLYLDPNEGLIQFTSQAEAKEYIERSLRNSYDELNESYDAFTLKLAT